MHKIITLNSGLRVIAVEVADAQSVTLLRGYAVGSRHEPDELAGISHFIEHMMFKGTVKRPSAKQLTRELDQVGAQYNAYTSKDHTAYYIKVSADQFELACDILSDLSYNATYPAEEIEKEKGVIVEEIKMYQDEPRSYVDELYDQLAFDGNSLGRDIIGSEQTVNNMNREKLINFRDRFYDDKNSLLVIAGKLPLNHEETLNKYFSGHPSAKHDLLEYEKFVPLKSGPKIKVTKKKVEQAHLQLGFHIPGFMDNGTAVYAVLASLLGGNMSSILYEELREKRGLCYYIHMHPIQFAENGTLALVAGLNQSKVESALEVILQVLGNMAQGNVSELDVEHAKDHILGSLKLSLEDTATRASLYFKRFLLTGELITPQDRIDRLKKVTKDDIIKAAKATFSLDNLNLALVASKDLSKPIKAVINNWQI